jgi:hypothetical protein
MDRRRAAYISVIDNSAGLDLGAMQQLSRFFERAGMGIVGVRG